MKHKKQDKDPIILVLENDFLRVEVVPALGGKISSIYNKILKKEFLWHDTNLNLSYLETGADYDANFWGGVDELLPNDIPEKVDNIDYPDHGELWTTELDYVVSNNVITLSGVLALSGLLYNKEISLDSNSPRVVLKYNIKNTTTETRHFLWKMHAALRISEGDYLLSSAKKGRIVNPLSSRFTSDKEFNWPMIENKDASIVPPKEGTMDFFYLYESQKGEMAMVSEQGKHKFAYEYGRNIFPYEWYFASFGQFKGHYVAILEPASAMPVSVAEAVALKQCSVLEPHEEINTIVKIYAGLNT